MSFRNRVGIELVADLYSPKRLRGRAPALIVGHPFGGVKEQTSGLYAQTTAERGFVILAFDASCNGESGGRPRHIASLETFGEDFSTAVDYLGTRRYVARDRIGVIGVCASGGFSLSAAQIDPRLKAVATVSMCDMGRAYRDGQGYAPVPSERNSVEERKRALPKRPSSGGPSPTAARCAMAAEARCRCSRPSRQRPTSSPSTTPPRGASTHALTP
ncbi:alpha/beta hydrolase [Streptomyces sp. NPDC053707]|uniref:alpha/beta hydrolase n=1 Tax=unclassified Streptomyces TaxID=2593676 RepID=UPI0033B9F6FF